MVNFPIYQITANDISRLSQEEFVDFLNRLLQAEGSRLGISPTDIQTSLRINDPDGGVDALVMNAPDKSSWIPSGNSAWQFKKSDIAPKDIKTEEFPKPGVQKIVRTGGSYCLVIGEDLTPIKANNRNEALQECFTEAHLLPNRRLYTAAHLAQWASEYPAIALLPYFMRPAYADFMRWETWARQARFQTPFENDQQRDTIITAAREYLHGDNGLFHFRLEGLAGIGKTRLALECCRVPGLQERVLYIESPNDIPRGLFHWLEQHTNTSAIVVVDECSREDGDKLQRQAERCSGRVWLLTVGLSQEVQTGHLATPGFYVLDKLSDEAMRHLLRTGFPTFPLETLLFIVRVSSGYVKLAMAIATTIARQPEIVSIPKLAQSPDVDLALSRFIVPDETNRRIMQAIALLSRVGWDGDLSQEGQTITAFLGLDNWRDVQLRVGRLVREGLIAKQGRYRYVTPHLLAVWLAAQLWADMGEDILSLLSLLGWNGRNAFLQRLSDLGDEITARRVCEFLLSTDALFDNLDDLEEQHKSHIFSILAEAHPQAGLRALERIIGHQPRDRLLLFKQGRRNAIWILEKLAWFPDTFFGATRLLLRLAEAENEDGIVNNATGVWISLFGIRLGGTAVPAIERHILLREALESQSLIRQLLAIQAIERALHIAEFGMPLESNLTKPLPPRWHPRNWEEDREIRRSALSLLLMAMESSADQIREAAMEAFVNSLRDLVVVGLGTDVVAILEHFPIERETRKHHLRGEVEQLLTFEASVLSPEHLSFFIAFQQRLAGQSFGERLRRWVGKWTHADSPRPRSIQQENPDLPQPQEMAAKLADEVIATPELFHQELDWMASEAAVNVFYFARRLGELDKEHQFWLHIESVVDKPNGMVLSSAYLRGHVEAGRRTWRNTILDDWVKRSDLAQPLLDAIWRTNPDDEDAYRLRTVIQNGWLEPGNVSLLRYGGETKSFSTQAFTDLLESIVGQQSEGSVTAGLSLLHQRLRFHPQEVANFESLAWQLLEAGIPANHNTMDEYDWQEVARIYLVQDAVRVTKVFLSVFDTHAALVIRENSLTQVLVEATKRQPADVWQLVSAFLLRRSNFRLYLYLRGWYAELFDPELLLIWAVDNMPRGPRIIAELTPVENGPLLPLARELLIRFGEDNAIGSTLYGNFVSGSFWGQESNWLEEKRQVASQWTRDTHEVVRLWAQQVTESLAARITQARDEEEESEY